MDKENETKRKYYFQSSEELVCHLKNDKGITFEKCSEEEAVEYIRNHNNYFKVTAYSKNYPKYNSGKNTGKYIYLDFGYLKDLAEIDMELRYIVMQMSLDIEHFAKIKILNFLEENDVDPILVCCDYQEQLFEEQKGRLNGEIALSQNGIYCKEMYEKYKDNCPVWVWCELIPFGRLVDFYEYCGRIYNNKKLKDLHYLLRTCKSIRNACAHSNCILNELYTESDGKRISRSLINEVSKIKSISKEIRTKRLRNPRINEIVTLLFVHKMIVNSTSISNRTKKQLYDFKERVNKNIDFYTTNGKVKNSLLFINQIIDNWF